MSKSIAIIGASNDRKKYGNKAVRAFADGGWTVYPVNPSAEEVEGHRCYASVADVPEPLTRISMYVPPRVGMRMLDDIAAKPHDELFFNPGSDSPDIIAAAKEKGLKPIQACSILDIGRTPASYPDA